LMWPMPHIRSLSGTVNLGTSTGDRVPNNAWHPMST
jgi:hypothetical protein